MGRKWDFSCVLHYFLTFIFVSNPWSFWPWVHRIRWWKNVRIIFCCVITWWRDHLVIFQMISYQTRSTAAYENAKIKSIYTYTYLKSPRIDLNHCRIFSKQVRGGTESYKFGFQCLVGLLFIPSPFYVSVELIRYCKIISLAAIVCEVPDDKFCHSK